MEKTVQTSNLAHKRNYGVDLLRMTAMFMIVILHVLGQGGILSTCGTNPANSEAAWFLEIASFCAVNCYALISGYVGLYANYRYTNIITLWLRVVYYTIIITAAFAYFLPESIGITEWLNAIFPVTTTQYWYFTAYVFLFLFIPLLNKAVQSLNQIQLRTTLLGLFFTFSLIQTICQQDIFAANRNYSSLWLILLYLLGAYIKKYNSLKNISIPLAILGYISMIIVTWGLRILINYATLYFLGKQEWGEMFVRYTSPTILASAIFLLALYEKRNLQKWRKITIYLLAPSAFSVYLIHANPLIWTYIMKNRFADYAAMTPANMILSVLGTALAIYLFCTLVDLIRRLLSLLLFRLKKKVQKLETKIVGDLFTPQQKT